MRYFSQTEYLHRNDQNNPVIKSNSLPIFKPNLNIYKIDKKCSENYFPKEFKSLINIVDNLKIDETSNNDLDSNSLNVIFQPISSSNKRIEIKNKFSFSKTKSLSKLEKKKFIF